MVSFQFGASHQFFWAPELLSWLVRRKLIIIPAGPVLAWLLLLLLGTKCTSPLLSRKPNPFKLKKWPAPAQALADTASINPALGDWYDYQPLFIPLLTAHQHKYMELSYFCCPIFGLKYRCWCEISADVVHCPFAEPQEAALFVTQYINPGSRETKLYFLIKQNDKNQLILHCRWKCGVAVNCLCNLPKLEGSSNKLCNCNCVQLWG